jgi:Protein of unknown function (DUF2009)
VLFPEKMRSEYGKLVYLMQDAVSETIQPLLGIDVGTPIKTVYSLLEGCGGLRMLDDELMATATEEILPDKSKNRAFIQQQIRRKEAAVEHIVRTYKSRTLSDEAIRHCLYSISDNNSFLNSNKKPVSDCIELLHQYFRPDSFEPGYSLSIDEGAEGSRLSHPHEQQFHYVHQSLALWAAILEDMFRLWYACGHLIFFILTNIAHAQAFTTTPSHAASNYMHNYNLILSIFDTIQVFSRAGFVEPGPAI